MKPVTGSSKKPKAEDMVVLSEAPAGLLGGLPDEDQQAILELLGKPILLVAYDDDGQAELDFTDSQDVIHTIFVKPDFMLQALICLFAQTKNLAQRTALTDSLKIKTESMALPQLFGGSSPL
jgi:hypothetical protein